MLKADFHLHCNKDPEDPIWYSPKKLIDAASEKGFDVLAITCHNRQYFTEAIQNYAEHKGIILIPGIERMLEIKHIIILNAKEKEVMKLKKIEDLKKLGDSAVVIAPHPFFPWSNALNEELVKHHKLFDAIEIHSFYTKWFNKNKEAYRFAKKHRFPLVGSSDAHWLTMINHTYTLIDAPKNKEAILDAIKKGKTRVVTKPLSMVQFTRIFIAMLISTAGYFSRLPLRKLRRKP